MSGEKAVISAESLNRYRRIFANLYGEVVSAPNSGLSEAQANHDGESWSLQSQRSGKASLFHFGFNKTNSLIKSPNNIIPEIPFLSCWFSCMLDLLLHKKFYDQKIEDIINRERIRHSTGISLFISEFRENIWHEHRLADICPPDIAASQIAKRCCRYGDDTSVVLVRWTESRDILPNPREFISVFELALALMQTGFKLSDYIICADDIYISLSDAAANGLVNDRRTNDKTMNSNFTGD